MNSKLTLGATGALLALVASSASAAVLVDYKMTAPDAALNSGPYLSPTILADNVLSTALANHDGAGNTGSNVIELGVDRVTTWNSKTGSGADTPVSYANAFAAGNYVTFSVTVAEGYQITFDSISFQAGIASASDTARRGVFLVTETSAANFSASSTVLASDVTEPAGGTLVRYADPAGNTMPLTYSASLAALGTLTSGQTQIFRLYFQTQDASQGIFLDDIVINGTVSPVAIPEPSAFAALAGLAGLGLAASRRRRG
jgi:hypothetical protein